MTFMFFFVFVFLTKLLFPGPTVTFTNVLETVREQVEELKTQSINKIIALGHLGYRLDKQVAEIDGVDIVVGGHTDTFLYSGEGNLNIFIRVLKKCLVSYVCLT